ncbi:olfactory receptor 6M1-like [Pelodytes ibericus]
MSLFVLFLFLYLIIIIGNFLIILLVYKDLRLHLPMYFFLGNISFIEICISSVVIPKFLSTLLSLKKTISFVGCIIQCYLYFLLGTVDFILLAAMSFDRYVAICIPLKYVIIMSWKRCLHLAFIAWLVGLLFVTFPAVVKAMLPYCDKNKIDHFFCDSTPLLELACIDTGLIKLIDFLLFSLVILTSFILTVVTYVIIVITIFRIPSVSGRHKVFSTCISHLFLVCLGYGSSIFIYIIPKKSYAIHLNKLVSVITVFVTPVLSPFIFTLRNQSVQVVLVEVVLKAKTYIFKTSNY